MISFNPISNIYFFLKNEVTNGRHQKEELFPERKKSRTVSSVISDFEMILTRTIELKVLMETIGWNSSRSTRVNQMLSFSVHASSEGRLPNERHSHRSKSGCTEGRKSLSRVQCSGLFIYSAFLSSCASTSKRTRDCANSVLEACAILPPLNP